MTELHPRAKSLIRLAKAAQEPSSDELRQVLEGLERRAGQRSHSNVSRVSLKAQKHGGGDYVNPAESGLDRRRLNHKAPRPSWADELAHQWRRRMLKWSLLAAIMTGSMGAFANWGPELPIVGPLAQQVKDTLGSLVAEVVGKDGSTKAAARVSASPVRESAVASVAGPVAVTGPVAVEAAQPVAVVASAALPPPPPPVLEASLVAPMPLVNSASSTRTTAASPRAAAGSAEPLTAPVPKGPAAFSEAEVNLIAVARSALAAGNYPQTRRLLDEHRTTFGAGALAEERETLRALVACRESGNSELARRYVARRPQSLFASRLIRECGLPAVEAQGSQ